MNTFMSKISGISKELVGKATHNATLEARGKTQQIVADFEHRVRHQ